MRGDGLPVENPRDGGEGQRDPESGLPAGGTLEDRAAGFCEGACRDLQVSPHHRVCGPAAPDSERQDQPGADPGKGRGGAAKLAKKQVIPRRKPLANCQTL